MPNLMLRRAPLKPSSTGKARKTPYDLNSVGVTKNRTKLSSSNGMLFLP
jgi:hypothetical protein